MKSKTHQFRFHNTQNQRGVALIASLIIMILMTLIALSIIRGNVLFERNAGNTRDKQRAFQAAQDALLYGEFWLNNGNGGSTSGVSCAANTALTKMTICSTDPGANPTNIAKLGWYTYTPTGLSSQSSGNSLNGGMQSNSATSDIIYSQSPGIYINCISCGTTLSTGQSLFRVTAIGYGGVGGTNGTVAIVQSVFATSGLGVPGSTVTPPCYSCND